MDKRSLSFPSRLHGDLKEVIIDLPESMGGSAKLYLREIAKNLPEYRQPINAGDTGRTDSGKVIPVDTAGKWLFGVPGYQGHIQVLNWESNTCTVRFPDESPEIIHDLIEALKSAVEGEHGT